MTPRTTAGIAALSLALALGGCSSDGDGASAEPTSGPASEPSASDSGSPTQTEVPTETASTPTVAPATGPEIAVRGLRAHVPEGWRASRPYAVMSAASPVGASGTIAYVFRFPNSGLLTTDEFGESLRKESGGKFELKTLDHVVLDGLTAFHVAGKVNPGEFHEHFGVILNDDRLNLTFEFASGEDKAARDEIIESVLATVDFREVKQGS